MKAENLPTEFEGDLRGAVFWGVDLRDATFRDANLTGATFSHVWLVDVEVDGLVDRLIVNGVDVTDYVNARDPWHPLRAMLRPDDAAGMRDAWAALESEWDETIDRARVLATDAVTTSVNGEWSFVETVRHLLFANDKWFGLPIAGDREFHPYGLPNSGSADLDWPGLDRETTPDLDAVVAARRVRNDRLATFLLQVAPVELDREVDVMENGPHPVRECVLTIFEEEFWHLRYARRDLATLA